MGERVRRIDSGELAAPERLANGMLRVSGRISRVGIQTYENPDGTARRELREPETVFDVASIASFRQVPVTSSHPPVLLDSKNARNFSVGSVGEDIKRDGDWLTANLMIIDADAIKRIESGENQLSCGYEATILDTPGTHPLYGAYDAIQRDVRGNHIATVFAARAGSEARLRLDAAGNCVIASTSTTTHQETRHMTTSLRIDGLNIDVTDANGPAIQQAIDRHVAALKLSHTDALAAATSAATINLDGVSKKLATVKKNAIHVLDGVAKIRRCWDAMKAKMIPCDECQGTGKVPAPDGKTDAAKCDYCDGAGRVRMHDAIKGMEPEKTGDPDGDGDMDAAVGEAEETDAGELETEQATETESGKAAKADALSRRAAADRKLTEDDRKLWRKRHADSRVRQIGRAMRARVGLETNARRYLDAADMSDADLAKLDDVGVMKAITMKLAPTTKLDGKQPHEIRARYDAEIERAPAFSFEDAREMHLRSVPAAGGAARGDSRSRDPMAARAAMMKREDEAAQKKTAK